jgi:hypothetical protein
LRPFQTGTGANRENGVTRLPLFASVQKFLDSLMQRRGAKLTTSPDWKVPSFDRLVRNAPANSSFLLLNSPRILL